MNEKLGKPIVNCDRIWERWGADKKQGSMYLSNVSSKNDDENDEDFDDDFDDDDDFGEENDDDEGGGAVLPEDCDFCEKTMGKERFEEMKKLFMKNKTKS